MVIATALGWGNIASIGMAVALAFLFGYSLTSLPLIRAKLPLASIVPIALAADTVSIAIMETIDNGFLLGSAEDQVARPAAHARDTCTRGWLSAAPAGSP
jgi:hypothetical protein